MKKEKAPVRRKTRKSGEKGTEIRSAVRSEFYQSIAELLRTARSNAYRAVNFVMVEAYWNVRADDCGGRAKRREAGGVRQEIAE